MDRMQAIEKALMLVTVGCTTELKLKFGKKSARKYGYIYCYETNKYGLIGLGFATCLTEMIELKKYKDILGYKKGLQGELIMLELTLGEMGFTKEVLGRIYKKSNRLIKALSYLGLPVNIIMANGVMPKVKKRLFTGNK